MKSQDKAPCQKKGQKLRFSAIILCFIIISFSLFSCQPRRSDALRYKSTSFTAEVSVRGGRIDFEAVFSVSAPDGVGERDFSVEFSSPESLKGMTVIQSGSNAKILLHGKEFLSAESELLRLLEIGKIAKMIAPDGSVRSIKSEDGLTAVYVGDVTVYIDSESSLPVKIVDKASGISVSVKSINKSEP